MAKSRGRPGQALFKNQESGLDFLCVGRCHCHLHGDVHGIEVAFPAMKLPDVAAVTCKSGKPEVDHEAETRTVFPGTQTR